MRVASARLDPGLPADLGETIRASDGVAYRASHEKAERELGFTPRPLERGIADTWGLVAEGGFEPPTKGL